MDAAEAGDQFRAAPTTSDFNGDGFADLAVGVAGEDVGSIPDAGAVYVIYGSISGVTSTWDELWSQDSPGVPGVTQVNDWFGSALAGGDFNGDGEDDLAVGAPFESDEDGANEASVGAVVVIHGAHGPVAFGGGLSTEVVGAQLWTQDSSGIEGTEEDNDLFGYSLVAGDFNGDGKADLAIGAIGEDVNGVVDAGAVSVLHGSDGAGLRSYLNQFWHQDSPGVLGDLGGGDGFGRGLGKRR